jgi:hypothetical protein
VAQGADPEFKPQYCKNKKIFYAMGRGRGSTQPIFSHLQGIDMSYRLKQTKNFDRRQKYA